MFLNQVKGFSPIVMLLFFQLNCFVTRVHLFRWLVSVKAVHRILMLTEYPDQDRTEMMESISVKLRFIYEVKAEESLVGPIQWLLRYLILDKSCGLTNSR